MKVKIGDKIYDGDKEPVMVILNDDDKYNISNMCEDCCKYLSYPENMSERDAEKFMEEDEVSALEESIIEDRRKFVDELINKIKKDGDIHLKGNFNIQLSYYDGLDINFEPAKGFSITLWPEKDGTGALIKFDPYDVKTNCGIIEIVNEDNQKENKNVIK